MIQYCHMRFLRLSVASFCLFAASAEASAVLTNCAEIAAYSPDNETESPRVHVTGQVLSARYCKKPRHPNCEAYYFFADKTGGVSLRASSDTLYKVGDILDLDGRLSCVGGAGYAVIGEDISILGHSTPPPPIPARLSDIKSGKYDYRIVSVTGFVIDAFRDEIDFNYFWIVLCQNGASLPLALPSHGVEPSEISELIGSEISTTGGAIPGVCGRRYFSAHIETSRTGIIVLKQKPTDDYNAPLLKSSTPFNPLQRYCLVGRVLAAYGNGQVFVQPDDGRPIEVRLLNGATPPTCGAHVRFSGLLDTDSFFVNLIQAVWRTEPGDTPEPVLSDVVPSDLLKTPGGESQINARYHGRIIRMKGFATQATIGPPDRKKAYLQCDGLIVPIDLSAIPGETVRHAPGTLLSITGVCRMEQDPHRFASEMPRLNGFSIIPRKPSDIQVLQTPPWWTPFKLIVVIGILCALLVIIFLWNISLRLIAERRGRELFRENVAHISADLRTDERTRLAVDLHDSLAQMLTGVSLQIDAGEYEIASKSLKSCRDELRNCLWDLRNQTLEERDMGEAIRRTLKPHIGTAQLLVRFNVPRTKLSDSTAHSVLMIVRELATNAVRHGHARTIRVAGGLDGDALMLSVRDDGTGFDPDNRPGMAEGHFGLQGIRERLNRCNGTMTIDSVLGKGTKVTISLKRQK